MDEPKREPRTQPVERTRLPDGDFVMLVDTGDEWEVCLRRVVDRGRDRYGKYQICEEDTLSTHPTKDEARETFRDVVREAL